MDDYSKNQIRSLAVSLHELGQIQMELGREDCVKNYGKAFQLASSIGDLPGSANCAANLGKAYKNISEIRDLDKAEKWTQKAFELHDESDGLRRGRQKVLLGHIAQERFRDASKANKPPEELAKHQQDALGYYNKALEMLPQTAKDDLATTHNALAILFGDAGLQKASKHHYQAAIYYIDETGDRYWGGIFRYNYAIDLKNAGMLQDALTYAKAAFDLLKDFGSRAIKKADMAKELIDYIELEIKQNKS